jgi:hypothetical protein
VRHGKKSFHYKLHFHETNVNEKNSIVEKKNNSCDGGDFPHAYIIVHEYFSL